ncbi:MAG: VIT domain-containing protein [Pseudomonadota bacterium]|nr:VIT domain-containing protein [Pseudomonadota bacterium]
MSPRFLRLGLLTLVLSCWPGGDVGAASRPVAGPRPGPYQRSASAEPAAVEVAPLTAPISLSDPDGQSLTLTSLSAKVAVDGPLSLTELELRFQNPQDRRIEGRFALTLPDGATISRFANEVNGQLVEGEVVERAAAHRAYDAILHEMRDPALLEMDAGNRFSAKVFPIEPRAEVRIVLSYTRLLRADDGARAYVLPLRGLPVIGEFSFHGRFAALPGEVTSDLPKAERSGDGVQHLDIVRRAWAPDADVAVRWRASGPAGTSPATQVLRSGDYYVATFQPGLPAAAATPGRWALYVDTSASAADGASHRIAAIEALLRSIPGSTPVAVYGFDQDVVRLAEGPASTVAASIGGALRDRGFAGGTDLARVLAQVAATARPDTRVVLATDGVATFGDTNPARLAAAARALPSGIAVHALVLGAEQDGAVLAALTEGRGRVVEIPFTDALAADAATAAARLSLPPGARFTAADADALWVHAIGAGDVTAGGEIVVVGKTRPGKSPAPSVTQEGTGRGRAMFVAGPTPDVKGTGPLVEREAIRAHLADLARLESEATSEEARATLAAEQVRLSVAHRVLCPKTTLLVLESEADYARFGLDRRALADILTVGPEGIAVAARATGAWGQADLKAKAGSETKAPSAGDADLARDGNGDGAEAGGAAEEASAGAEESEPSEEKPSEAPPSAEPASERKEDMADDALVEADKTAESAPRPSPSSSASASSPARRAPAAAPPPPGSAGRGERRERAASQGAPTPTEAPAWIHAVEVPSTTLAALEANVAANPRDREAYNQLANALLQVGDMKRLGAVTREWQPYDPDNPHVYEVMGEAALAQGDLVLARRAFGSLVELAGGKPELLQRAGLLLWRAGDPTAAEVPLRRAIELRPDRVNAHRHLAFVLRASGRYAEAAEVLEAARTMTFPSFYQGIGKVLTEELGIVYRDWMAAVPAEAAAIRARAAKNDADPTRVDALRVTLAWETDGNDVDLHVVDPAGETCFYGNRQNRSGLELYEDLTGGLGPEVIRAKMLPPGRYSVGVKYFSAGPMGVSRGLVIVEVPGKAPRVEPFRLVEGGGDVRLLTTVDVAAG